MEQDDLLDDLLSWTPSTAANSSSPQGADDTATGPAPSATAAASQPPRRAASLQEACVNTSPSGCGGGCGGAAAATTAEGCTASSPSTSTPALALSSEVQTRLYPHQLEGVQWLYQRHCKARACLLADEMGLGKTVQVAVFLGELYARRIITTSILVVPPTLLPVWTAALAEWGGAALERLVEVIHSDTVTKRRARWRKLRYGLPCVLLTTYGVLRQDASEMSATLVDYVVLDEAHLIKDTSTGVFKGAVALAARHKIALTGTPLMNTFEDMWSLFRFLDGSIIGMDKAVFTAASATMRRGNEGDASAPQRDAAADALARLQAAVRPFMLRREKADLAAAVLSSEKRDVVVWVRLTAVQRRLYAAFLELKEATAAVAAVAAAEMDLSEAAEEDAVVGGSAAAAVNPLLLLTLLSQVCNHPWLSLVDAAFAAALTDNPYAAPVEEMGDIFSGSKVWVALRLLLRCIAERRKTLLFSRSRRPLQLLAFLLREWRVSYTQVDGDTPSDRRTAAVAQFNADPDVWVCLATTQVGGVGLTFTAASAVVLFDPSWNPAADAQAVDRVHRIGQQRDVIVFRLVTCGTVEEKMYRNQIFKRMAALQAVRATATATTADASVDDAIDSSQPPATGEPHRHFTRVQLRNMFSIDDVDSSSTAQQLAALYPGQVCPRLREELCQIDGVCDLSDNACVLTGEVVDRAGAPDSTPRNCTPASQAAHAPTTLCVSATSPTSRTPPARTRPRSPSPDTCDAEAERGAAVRRRRMADEDGLAPTHAPDVMDADASDHGACVAATCVSSGSASRCSTAEEFLSCRSSCGV
ncbi:DNA excision/repair protein SNF2 [Novymonas esmeraldas]|uniref:DNA excision/repair protein SNF2 n=1 Tax=Novymonas esmeraldas TaxID=1808958 RepID=A0AAW0ENI9_9TRYP